MLFIISTIENHHPCNEEIFIIKRVQRSNPTFLAEGFRCYLESCLKLFWKGLIDNTKLMVFVSVVDLNCVTNNYV